MDDNYDVVVVGAGCAGALASQRIASKGFRVLLIDRRRSEEFGHESHDLVEEDALELSRVQLGEAAGADSGPGALDVISPDTATHVRISGTAFKVVDRRALMDQLIEGARESGVEILSQCIANGAEIEKGFVTGVSTDRGSFHCRLTVSASGLDRVLCMNLPTGMGIPRRLRTGDFISIYRETRDLSGDSLETPSKEPLQYHVGRYGGYSWTYTGQAGSIDIGTGVQDLPEAPDPREIVLGYVRSNPGVGERVISREGGRVPARRPLSSMVTNGMVVVGDAAVSALEADDVSVAALWKYNHDYMLVRGAHLAALDCLRVLMQRMPEKEFSWSMAKGVIDEPEIASALTGKFEVPTPQAKIMNLLKGLAAVPLLRRYENTLKYAQKVLDHYMSYPSTYDAPDFADWSQEADFLFEDVEKI